MAQSVVPVNAHVVTTAADYKTIVDESTAGTTYVGRAIIGSATSDPVWRIQRIVEASSVTTITYAGVDGNYPSERQIWDNRASLSYS